MLIVCQLLAAARGVKEVRRDPICTYRGSGGTISQPVCVCVRHRVIHTAPKTTTLQKNDVYACMYIP